MSDIISENSVQEGEIPAFLRDLLRKEYAHESERIFSGYEKTRPVTLRANSLKISAEEAEREFEERGIAFSRVEWYQDAFILPESSQSEIMRLPLYERGEIYLQSLSSMLPPLLIAPQAEESILDMTAAPGGKTAQISALSRGKALITACERDPIRFDRLKFNLQRQGVVRVNAMKVDSSLLDDFFRFDKILLDAPCSGSGTICSKKPVRFSEKLLAGCMKSQSALLRKACRLLKSGGILVYSTCSVLKEENEEQIKKVRKEFEICPVEGKFLGEISPLPGEFGVTVCPDGLFEGFYLCVLKKK